VFKKGKKQLTVYQPQVDYWNGYTNLHFRCAIAVKGVSKQEKFGVAEVDALTVTDHGARVVAIVPLKRELRFANVPERKLAKLRQAVEQLHPSGQAITLSLDRVIAYLDPATQPVQPPWRSTSIRRRSSAAPRPRSW
jgi:antitoxin (DNA-binding transcriptional repressor) of toxin-antitoxin stability system